MIPRTIDKSVDKITAWARAMSSQAVEIKEMAESVEDQSHELRALLLVQDKEIEALKARVAMLEEEATCEVCHESFMVSEAQATEMDVPVGSVTPSVCLKCWGELNQFASCAPYPIHTRESSTPIQDAPRD